MGKRSAALQMAVKQQSAAATKAPKQPKGSKKKVEQQEAQQPASTTGQLQERAILARLATGRWYGRMTDSEVIGKVREQHAATGDIGIFTKRLMKREYLADIDGVVNEARRYHKAMTLPWFDQMRILSADLWLDYRNTMNGYQVQFEEEVRKFAKRYDELKESEKERLGQLYRESDYPSRSALLDRFYMKVRFEPVPDANDFRAKLGGDDVEAIRTQIEEQLSASLREATLDLWKRLYSLVKKLRDVLQSSDAGVRKSLFTNLKEVVAIMPKLNLIGDAKLEELTKRVADELLKEDVEAIKDDEAIRKDVGDKANKILDAMTSFLGESLDDEDEAE